MKFLIEPGLYRSLIVPSVLVTVVRRLRAAPHGPVDSVYLVIFPSQEGKAVESEMRAEDWVKVA